ncbi:MAG TPA: hypothetical protein VLW26_04495 [Steroidobacteraceae bacterium]|nr:hypothetical protein [Steroidobacteraceae bacterium]
MNIYKIVGIIGILIAIVGAFVHIPWEVALLSLAGVIVGISIVADQHVRVIVSAIALPVVAASFNEVPQVGPWITAIIAGLGHLAGGAALFIILRNIYNRMFS